MKLNFSMIAADTSRTRAYLTELKRKDLLPKSILFLIKKNSNYVPGKVSESSSQKKTAEKEWPESNFSLDFNLLEFANENSIKYTVVNSTNINDDIVIQKTKEISNNLILYSGYGGGILRENILKTQKYFLHIHGGYLPFFKGSTTNYYSILEKNYVGASAIILSKNIDCGPVIYREKFKVPNNKNEIDHCLDSAFRSRVLIKSLRIIESKGLQNTLNFYSGGSTYFIIHPVLKHIAIMSK